MQKNIYLSFALFLFLVIPVFTSAEESCGNIVDIEDGERYEYPIEDCENPFGVPHLNPDIEVSFGDTDIEEGEEYSFIDQSKTVQVSGSNAFFISGTIYLHEGEDYIRVRNFSGPSTSHTFTEAGVYTLVVEEMEEPILIQRDRNTWLTTLKNILIPKVHAYHGPSLILTFELVEPEPEPEVDPLILQYEPILHLHPDENFEPMNVEAFVEASALWDDDGVLPDELVKPASTSDPVTIEDISIEGSEDLYLAFSDLDESKSFDPDVAKDKYDELVTDEKAVPTYYAYKMEDSFTDEEGEEHKFIVLQYWYFYAFNDWQEHGGFNNHEGDWESVFVFLDKDTEDPKYVAYSAHHNDGDPGVNLSQYDSVRRSWESNEIEREGNQIKSFVAVGSHANYPNNENDGNHTVVTLLYNDLTSADGVRLATNDWYPKTVLESDPMWMKYEGKWGVDSTSYGFDGPRGPYFIDIGGTKRFRSPTEWAGVDKVIEKIISEETSEVVFENQSTTMVFSENIPVGTTISVDQHDEPITFGVVPEETTLLPHFWDLDSSLENGTFEAAISFEYDESELALWEVEDEDLSIFFYADDDNAWEQVPSEWNTETSTVSFEATHFSRYAIGATEPETIEEIYDRLHSQVDDLDLRRYEERGLHFILKLAEFMGNRPHGRSQTATLRMLNVFEWKISWYENKKRISSEEAEKIKEDVVKIRSRSNSLE